jgi:putative transposase
MPEIRTGRHCVFMLHAHLVFVTKSRSQVFDGKALVELEEIFERVCGQFDVELMEFDGEHDHVHLLVNYPPKISLSKLVNSLKGVSSRLIRESGHKGVDRALGKAKSLWSPSYFAGSCGGAPLDVVKQYIESQSTPE